MTGQELLEKLQAMTPQQLSVNLTVALGGDYARALDLSYQEPLEATDDYEAEKEMLTIETNWS